MALTYVNGKYYQDGKEISLSELTQDYYGASGDPMPYVPTTPTVPVVNTSVPVATAPAPTVQANTVPTIGDFVKYQNPYGINPATAPSDIAVILNRMATGTATVGDYVKIDNYKNYGTLTVPTTVGGVVDTGVGAGDPGGTVPTGIDTGVTPQPPGAEPVVPGRVRGSATKATLGQMTKYMNPWGIDPATVPADVAIVLRRIMSGTGTAGDNIQMDNYDRYGTLTVPVPGSPGDPGNDQPIQPVTPVTPVTTVTPTTPVTTVQTTPAPVLTDPYSDLMKQIQTLLSSKAINPQGTNEAFLPSSSTSELSQALQNQAMQELNRPYGYTSEERSAITDAALNRFNAEQANDLNNLQNKYEQYGWRTGAPEIGGQAISSMNEYYKNRGLAQSDLISQLTKQFQDQYTVDRNNALTNALNVNTQIYGQARGDFADMLSLVESNRAGDQQEFTNLLDTMRYMSDQQQTEFLNQQGITDREDVNYWKAVEQSWTEQTQAQESQDAAFTQLLNLLQANTATPKDYLAAGTQADQSLYDSISTALKAYTGETDLNTMPLMALITQMFGGGNGTTVNVGTGTGTGTGENTPKDLILDGVSWIWDKVTGQYKKDQSNPDNPTEGAPAGEGNIIIDGVQWVWDKAKGAYGKAAAGVAAGGTVLASGVTAALSALIPAGIIAAGVYGIVGAIKDIKEGHYSDGGWSRKIVKDALGADNSIISHAMTDYVAQYPAVRDTVRGRVIVEEASKIMNKWMNETTGTVEENISKMENELSVYFTAFEELNTTAGKAKKLDLINFCTKSIRDALNKDTMGNVVTT